ncbi:hypothetical protein [Streptomyces sp. NPDC014623]|uniref:hypothetical protein n=1 Tax=Streptomyces sp. NPDC014623 TaxID=3364875 RepID=UPI0036F5BCF6
MPDLIALPPLSNENLMSTAIPIDLSSATPKPLYRLITGPLSPGEQLDITADARVSNAAGYPGGTRYTVGVGWHLWRYTYVGAGASTGTWTRIGHYSGSNVTADTHHLDLHINRHYTIPDDWTPGDRMAIVLQADAHSTAWKANGGNDTLTVDSGYGQLIVRPWVTAPAPPEPEPCTCTCQPTA